MTYSPDDFYNDPIMDAVFESFFDMKNEDNSWNYHVHAAESPPERKSPKVQKKRKSLDWDSKPLEKRRDSGQKSVRKPVKSASTSSLCSIDRQNYSTYEQNEHNDLYIETPLDLEPLAFIPDLTRDSGDSVDDSLDMFSSLFLDSKSEDTGQLHQAGSKGSDSHLDKELVCEDELAKKRSKWSDDELRQLWEGISKHGNNWTDIMGEVTTRSYCQIKDKGRRCLFLLGWRTGRSKVETDSSSLHAKRIANQILANWGL